MCTPDSNLRVGTHRLACLSSPTLQICLQNPGADFYRRSADVPDKAGMVAVHSEAEGVYARAMLDRAYQADHVLGAAGYQDIFRQALSTRYTAGKSLLMSAARGLAAHGYYAVTPRRTV